MFPLTESGYTLTKATKTFSTFFTSPKRSAISIAFVHKAGETGVFKRSFINSSRATCVGGVATGVVMLEFCGKMGRGVELEKRIKRPGLVGMCIVMIISHCHHVERIGCFFIPIWVCFVAQEAQRLSRSRHHRSGRP